jgi:hypothetical protein
VHPGIRTIITRCTTTPSSCPLPRWLSWSTQVSRLRRGPYVAHDHPPTRSTFCRKSQALDNRAQCPESSAGGRADAREIRRYGRGRRPGLAAPMEKYVLITGPRQLTTRHPRSGCMYGSNCTLCRELCVWIGPFTSSTSSARPRVVRSPSDRLLGRAVAVGRLEASSSILIRPTRQGGRARIEQRSEPTAAGPGFRP